MALIATTSRLSHGAALAPRSLGSGRAAALRPRIVRVHAEPAATATGDDQEGKMATTISTLDSLLGVPPAPAEPQQPAPRAVAAATSSSPGLSLPKLPLPPAAAGSGASQGKAAAGMGAVMGFAGYAPELINGRAAMLGFVAAISSELGNGESLWAQLVSGGGAKALLVILAVTVASFAPLVRQAPMDKVFGADQQPASWGPFTVAAERANARAAMLGLLALVLLEGASSQAFFM